MSKREPLKVGDRVRVQCVNSTRTSGIDKYEHFELSHFNGKIREVLTDKNGKNVYQVSHDDNHGLKFADSLVPLRHLIRLRPKPKREGECPKFFFHEQFTDARDGYEITKLSVIRPGEIIVQEDEWLRMQNAFGKK